MFIDSHGNFWTQADIDSFTLPRLAKLGRMPTEADVEKVMDQLREHLWGPAIRRITPEQVKRLSRRDTERGAA